MSFNHPYFTCAAGSWQESAFLAITGGYDPVTMQVGVNEPRPLTNLPWFDSPYLRMTCVPTGPYAQMPGVMRVTTRQGQAPDPTRPWISALYNGVWDDGSTPAFIGEMGAANCVTQPYEPLLTMNPIAGEEFTVQAIARIYAPDTKVQSVIVPCRYRTLHVREPWGPMYPNTIRTALEERYTTPGAPGNLAYNYIWALGIGLVDWWVIDRSTGQGNQFYGTANG